MMMLKIISGRFKQIQQTFVLLKRHKHEWFKPIGHDLDIKIYNCIMKDKVPFIVRNKDCVTWYTCGPTVYDSAHIGHACSYVKLDIIQRILREHFKLNLVTVMNITDIDDKIINRSKTFDLTVQEIVKKYEYEFWMNLKSLKVIEPNIVVRVTDSINIIQNFIETLMEKGKAYERDGSVYFDLSNYKNYGKLQNVIVQEEAIENKKLAADFALWKKSKVGEPSWDSRWGPGRPGWHIECSAMAGAVFGRCIDVHAGGIDLQFPHHENEETQSCAYYDTNQWVNYWLHTGHLHLSNQEKMSKSLKNTISIQEMLQHTSSDVFRMACLMSHYRSNMEYSSELIKTAEAYLNRMKSFLESCDAYINGLRLSANIKQSELISCLNKSLCDIDHALKDDFNTAKVLKLVMDLVSVTNRMLDQTNDTNIHLNTTEPVIAVANSVRDVLSLFGIDLMHSTKKLDNRNDLSNILELLSLFRQNVRNAALQNKNSELLKLCDNVREDLKFYGVTIKDHGKLSSWSK